MSKDYSPFTPGQPVPIEFFVGRKAEVEDFVRRVRAAAQGRLQTVFLVGERGIGKSSLAAFVRALAEREHALLGMHAFLGGVTALEETVQRIFDRLLKESSERTWFGKIKRLFKDHIRQVGLFGVTVEFAASETDLQRLVRDFVPSLGRVINELTGEVNALLLILDDINGLATNEHFANWLKSVVDEIATSGQRFPLCLVLVGLEERRESLVRLQPSLARVFHIIEVKTWSDEETREFFQKAFTRVNVRVEDAALDILCQFTGGLPMMAHEIGDATFHLNDDDSIDADDALRGVFAAADIVGRKYLEPQVFQAIRSARYRDILRKIAQKPFDISFTARELRPLLNCEEQKVFHNFLQRMKKLGVVEPDLERGRGAYRFTNRLHYLYFWLEAERVKKTRKTRR
ncbi:MAG: hypothetical protein KatS3mg112_0348 [Thermogutta sp.]|nr:MAG: hypothetical protein KatS3mg112_0348 [Thermogutta sp.]